MIKENLPHVLVDVIELNVNIKVTLLQIVVVCKGYEEIINIVDRRDLLISVNVDYVNFDIPVV